MDGLKAHIYKAAGVLILLFLLPSSLCAAEKNQAVHIQPGTVNISSFFSGIQMNITGDLPRDCQAVLSIRGKRIEAELMRKSHQWELWMNRGEVDIENAPSLYIALSSEKYLLSRGSGQFPWGYDAQENKARFRGRLKQAEDDTIFDEFIQLKERDELYRLYPGDLIINRSDPDHWKAEADFRLPSRIRPGTYYVTLWIVRDGRNIERLDSSFEVRRQGLPALLSSMAVKHGLFYGFMAVFIAMIVGMLTGLVFHRRGGGGH